MLVQCSRECTPPYLSTGISNLLQPAQAEVVLGQRSTYLASCGISLIFYGYGLAGSAICNSLRWLQELYKVEPPTCTSVYIIRDCGSHPKPHTVLGTKSNSWRQVSLYTCKHPAFRSCVLLFSWSLCRKFLLLCNELHDSWEKRVQECTLYIDLALGNFKRS